MIKKHLSKVAHLFHASISPLFNAVSIKVILQNLLYVGFCAAWPFELVCHQVCVV